MENLTLILKPPEKDDFVPNGSLDLQIEMINESITSTLTGLVLSMDGSLPYRIAEASVSLWCQGWDLKPKERKVLRITLEWKVQYSIKDAISKMPSSVVFTIRAGSKAHVCRELEVKLDFAWFLGGLRTSFGHKTLAGDESLPVLLFGIAGAGKSSGAACHRDRPGHSGATRLWLSPKGYPDSRIGRLHQLLPHDALPALI